LWLVLPLFAAALLLPGAALASGCFAAMAQRPAGVVLASFQLSEAKAVDLSFLGHASFLIESPGGVSIVTDYNGYNRPAFTPDIVTMNHAHSTHYTEHVEPGVKYVLRGWDPQGGVAQHDLKYADVRIRNIVTNIRDWGSSATEFGGNSIFVFEAADLCIAHLGHLHHTLTKDHLAALGQVDVLLAPVDGAWTMTHQDMIEVIEQTHPALVVPMHYFGPSVLQRFIDHTGGQYPVHTSPTAHVALSREMLPKQTEILVLPGD
jgi:L-ascorbate metabolism protein UlaG (beta-lactamase superfamily)